jgi:hypothetical protein
MLDFNGELFVKDSDPLSYPAPQLGSGLLLLALFLEWLIIKIPKSV